MKEIDHNSHSIYLMYYHLIIVVKYRRNVINDPISKRVIIPGLSEPPVRTLPHRNIQKARLSAHKNHMKGPRKRTEEDDVRFAQSFEKLILMAKSKDGAQSGTI